MRKTTDRNREPRKTARGISVVGLLVSLALVASACSGTSGAAKNPATTQGSDTTVTSTDGSTGDGDKDEETSLKVAYIGNSASDEFQLEMRDLLQVEVEKRSWELAATLESDGDVGKQGEFIAQLVEDEVDVIILVPVPGEETGISVKRAQDAGVAIFSIFDIVDEAESVAVVRGDNKGIGEKAADQVTSLLRKDPCWPNDCKILELQGDSSSANGLDRSEGFSSTLTRKAPSVELIQREVGWDPEAAGAAVAEVLSSNPELDGVFIPSEMMVDSVNQALEGAGRGEKAGTENAVLRITVDGTPTGLSHIRNGDVDSTISQPLPSYISAVLDISRDVVLDGNRLEVGDTPDGQVVKSPAGLEYQLDGLLINSSNVDDESHWGNANS